MEAFLFGKCAGVAFEQHGAATAAATVLQCLHTADDLDFFVGLQSSPACRRVHAVGAAAMHVGAVEQDVELCL